ncbi:tandem-95 repeat protein [bacterium]|nr:MAG: tandem-95 repeat protein [bacterium]
MRFPLFIAAGALILFTQACSDSVEVHNPPVFDLPGSVTVDENSTVAFILTATDIDGGVLRYGAASLPQGASFVPATGEFDWTPGYSDAGSYEVVFTVSDGELETTKTVTITVNNVDRAPVLEPIVTLAVDENSTLSYTLAAADPDGDTLACGAEGLPAGATLNGSTGELSWATGYSDAGSYDITFTVSDGFMEVSETVTVTVNNVNRAPVLEPTGSRGVDENSALSFTLAATDPDGDTLAYGAEGLPAGATLNASTGDFGWTPGYSDAGSYDITFTISDGTLEDSETVTITVANVNRAPVLGFIGPIIVFENAILELTLEATDPDGDEVAFSASGLPPRASFNPSTGEISWAPVYSDAGIYYATFTVSDGTLEDSESITITTPYTYPTDPDGYENDSGPENAGLLEIGEIQFRSIFPVGDADWMRISLTGGVTYEFTTSHLSINGDTWLWLFDTDGTTCLTQNDDCVGYDSCFQYTPAADGDYYLKVNGYIIRGLMSYSLEVHPFVDNDGDNWSAFHDCNETDPGINPKATDIAGDGIDQNCTGTDALVAEVPDPFEDDDTMETATELVTAQGMQYEFTRRSEFFPEAMHTLHDLNDVDWFTVDIPPHEMVGVEVIGYYSWPLQETTYGIILLEVADTSLRTNPKWDGYVLIANDTETPQKAFLRTIEPDQPLSYVICAIPQGFDIDMDGSGTMGMWFEHDCDDTNPGINDNAFDIPGDGIDQDCDGVDAISGSGVSPVRNAPLKRRR